MVTKRISQHDAGPLPLDEAWWAALLSEEGGYDSSKSEHPKGEISESKLGLPHSQSKQIDVDWDRVRDLYKKDETLNLPVTGYNRGGLLVDGSGLYGFVPLSHLVDLETKDPEAERESLLAVYIGQILCLKVIECDQERGRIVFSQRAAAAGAGRRNQLFETLKIGNCVHGTVTNVTAFGVFVDLGGVEGLIHVSELSWGRVRHPADVVSVGNQVEALVINVDKERSRVALSLKRLHPNPWETAEERYYPGQIIEAIITSVVPFGAFARLEEGLDGLIHVTEMGSFGENPNPQQVVSDGQHVQVRILHVDSLKQRLGLSLNLQSET